MRIVVTGGAGFIGSHIVDALVERGDEVLVIDDLSHPAGVPIWPPGVSPLVVDVRDPVAHSRIMSFGPSAIYHLAARSTVLGCERDVEDALRVNVEGTRAIALVAARCEALLVLASTGGAMYGDAPRPTPETAAPAPSGVYGVSKLAAELAADVAAPAILRLANVYGERQRGDGEAGIVAILRDHAARGAAPTLRGDGIPTRDFVHVSDVVRAFLLAWRSGTWNIGTGVETSIRHLWRLIHGGPANLAPLHEGELAFSCLDARRAAEDLGWTPSVAIADGLRLFG